MKGFRLLLYLCVCIFFILTLFAASRHTVYGVLDRYTDNGFAVILIEENNKELFIKKKELPASSREGVWFQIRENAGEYTIIAIDWERSEKKKDESHQIMEKLRNQ